jgi:hypothetical protein
VSSLYNFGANRIEITTSNSASIILVPIRCCRNVPREPLSNNGRLWRVSLTACFRRSGIMSQYSEALHFLCLYWVILEVRFAGLFHGSGHVIRPLQHKYGP